MLPKKNRADKKLVEKIFQEGSFVGFPFLSLKYHQKKNTNPPRISFIVPKKIEKGAARRNYLRRRGYLVLEKYFFHFPNGFAGVFIFNKKERKDLMKNIEKEIGLILKKIKI